MDARDEEDEGPVPAAAAEQIVSEGSAQRFGLTYPILPGASRSVPAVAPDDGRGGERAAPTPGAPERGLPGDEQVRQRPSGALERLRKRLERGGGLRGARLAELALRAGITVPPREAEMNGAGSLEAALWVELMRENAALRHEADKLAERQEILKRRIQRAKGRLQELRLKVIERRTGLTAKDLGIGSRASGVGSRKV